MEADTVISSLTNPWRSSSSLILILLILGLD